MFLIFVDYELKTFDDLYLSLVIFLNVKNFNIEVELLLSYPLGVKKYYNNKTLSPLKIILCQP